MSRSASSLLAALLLTTALLFPGPAAAEPWNAHHWIPGDLLTRLSGLITSIWNKEGCILDPHGACVASSSSAQEKAGCKLDPHGACIESQSTPGPTQKIGCGLDPHGVCGI